MSYDDDLMHADQQLIRTFGRPVRLPSLPEPVLAIYDEPYARTDIPGGGFIKGQVITLTAITSEMNGLSQRDVLSVPRSMVNGEWADWTDYTVREIEPDGSGLSVIYLDPVTGSKNSKHEIY
ncbi:head-tail joining protein [Klebsiella aerogenes]|uniref:head-tail joining protein n=1 Tax=Klebsiella aerogenes TaxID=548 RepID=UPI0034D380FC